MKKIYFIFIAFCLTTVKAQTVSYFMDTTSFGCQGLTIGGDYLYVASAGGNIHRKKLNTTGTAYDTFDMTGTAYTGICKIGDHVYIAKYANAFDGPIGIYKFNPDAPTLNVEYYLAMSNVYGMTYRNFELYFSAADKIYKVDLLSATPAPVQIAANINGSEGFDGSTMGLKIRGILRRNSLHPIPAIVLQKATTAYFM